ncbi:hypothetical protein HOU91_gp42 [Enterobacter phage EcpYZU01]|uniref:hypothetical protein n=1 Tax=Enterobacter phage EcpYZU01 TaxID=2483604 RepID=UPI0018ACA61A|nr:hypothetical protein HOU91_gp42 [Enterobacter phage EcpYZU01]
MSQQPLDFLGQPIEVGDKFIYAEAGGRGGTMALHSSVVTRMTEKQVPVAKTRWGQTWRPFNCIVIVEKAAPKEKLLAATVPAMSMTKAVSDE